jgi:hypothetical protein
VFVLFAQLLRFLLVVLILRIVLRGLVQMFRGGSTPLGPASGGWFGRSPASAPRTKGRLGVDLVKDSICNTYVPRDRAIRAVVRGREEHFCSAECRGRALAAAQAS